jgi:hypothetical protein
VKQKISQELEIGRRHDFGHQEPYANYGAFEVNYQSYKLFIISSGSDNGTDWEHVSVSLKNGKMPNWDMMNFVKDLFWNDDETVIQFHPKKSEYVNIAKNCLHLWRNVKGHELPETFLV